MEKLIFSYADNSFSPLQRSMIRAIERVTGQPKLKRLYLEYRASVSERRPFFEDALARLDIAVDIDPEPGALVPATGPLVVVANHPFGVLDGVVVSWLMEKAGRDFRVLTNAALLRVPEVMPYLLPVDFSGTDEAMRTNLATRASARRHLDAGGAVVVFPAGAVSTAPDRLGRHPAVDAPWQPFTAQLIQRSRATVLPLYFHGQNSRLFQIASHLNLALRLSLLFKEVHDRMHTRVGIRIGRPIAFEEIGCVDDRRAMIDELRRRTYALAPPEPPASTPGRGRLRPVEAAHAV